MSNFFDLQCVKVRKTTINYFPIHSNIVWLSENIWLKDYTKRSLILLKFHCIILNANHFDIKNIKMLKSDFQKTYYIIVTLLSSLTWERRFLFSFEIMRLLTAEGFVIVFSTFRNFHNLLIKFISFPWILSFSFLIYVYRIIKNYAILFINIRKIKY